MPMPLWPSLARVELAALAKSQAELDQIHGEQHAAYVKAEDDWELGFFRVQKALEKLRAYCGGAAFVQQQVQ